MAGFGSQPFGGSPYGLGTPAVASPLGGSVLRDEASGATHGSRSINPVTGDYDVDEHGRVLGMSNVKQLVLLAVGMDKGSSAARSFGQALKHIDRITPNFARRVDYELRTAVNHLTSQGLIEVIDTSAEVVRPGVAYVRLRWRDLTTGLADEAIRQLT